MSSDARALPRGEAPIGEPSAGLPRRSMRIRARALADVDAATRVGLIALIAIVALSLLIVVMAADRPSILSPTTHVDFYPRWMAGPLGGLWPGMTTNSSALKYLFSGAVVVMYIAYLAALRRAASLPLRWLIAAILAVHAIFILAPPLALTDVFNYINYGRMEIVHHLNPYTSIPISEPHSDPSYILSNWHQLLSPYGPLFTLLTFAVVPLGVAGSFWALKVILALASLGTILLVWRCAQLLGRDGRTAIVLVGLNPIVLVWGLGGDHNDFLMVFFIMLGFYLLLLAHSRESAPGTAAAAGGLRRWLLPLSGLEIGAGAAFVVATAIKASGGVLLPIVLVVLLRRPRTLVQVVLGMALASVLVAALSLMAFGLHIPDLSTQSRLVTNESIPNLLGLALGAGGESSTIHTVMSGLLAISLLACCWLAWRRRDAITAAGWASVALLLTLSWVLPWYVLWVLPLAALSRSRALRTATVLVGVYLIIAWAPASGLLWNAIGFHPEKTTLGRLHERWVRELLN